MSIEITEETFTKALEEAVQERGEEWTYPKDGYGGSCYYFVDGAPSCLIGLALSKLGYGPDDVTEDTSAADVLMDLGVTDRELASAAEGAQSVQDVGGPWGKALAYFYTRMGVEG